jgi:putrescine transport system substrate-binding protein
MIRTAFAACAVFAAALVLPVSAGAQGSKELNILNWADYIAPDTIANFEKETGIKVRYDTFDANETLHARLVAGKTGYDIVVPGAHFAKMQIDGKLLLELDRAKLTNWKNLDPALLEKLAIADPGNKHLVNWLWGFVTVGINPDKVKKALGDLPMPANPLDLLFDPKYVSRLKSCGTHVLDSASRGGARSQRTMTPRATCWPRCVPTSPASRLPDPSTNWPTAPCASRSATRATS